VSNYHHIFIRYLNNLTRSHWPRSHVS